MGDYIRWAPPFHEGADESAQSALFLALNRGKRSIRLDLKKEAGREVLLRLVREHDVLLESFRPGVMERLGVGYERLREENPRLVYCAITGYGQDGPYTRPLRPRHELPRPERAARPDRRRRTARRSRAPGQIADLGGGALMAAFGILAALRERERSGEGQLVDVSMFDGSLSWLALVAAALPRRGHAAGARRARARGRPHLLPAVRVQRRLGHARRARAEVLAGVVPRGRARGPRGEAVRAARARTRTREVERIFLERTRDEWQAFASEHDCCLEPVLGLDEALDSELVRAREMVVELDQPGAESAVRLLGVPVKLSRTPGAPAGPGPALGEHTEEVLGAARLFRRGDRGAARVG